MYSRFRYIQHVTLILLDSQMSVVEHVYATSVWIVIENVCEWSQCVPVEGE